MKSIIKVPDKSICHGIKKSELMQRIADGCGSKIPSFLTSESGMPHDNPLKAKGKKIMSNMRRQYGSKKGKEVFYASKNAKKITGVD